MEVMDRQRLAEYVVRRRNELGLKQQQVVDRAGGGLSLPVLSQIENARNERPRSQTLFALDRGLAWATGSAVNVLSGGEPSLAPVAAANELVATDYLSRDIQLPEAITLLPARVLELERRLDVLAARLDRLTAFELAAAEQDAVESTSPDPNATDADPAAALGDRDGRPSGR